MEARELFTQILGSGKEKQIVVDCSNLPVGKINPEECRQAYQGMSRVNQMLIRSRIGRYVLDAGRQQTPQAQQLLVMLKEVQQVIG